MTPTDRLKRLAPGLLICLTGAALALAINRAVPMLSALLVAIVAGAVVTNTIGIAHRWTPGVQFAAKRVLRLGIVLLGLQLSLREIGSLGVAMIGVVLAVVAIGIAGTWLVGHALNIGVRLRILVACGFSICGAAAVAAVDGVMETEEEEVATAIALVVLFGTLMIPLVPLVTTSLGLPPHQAGLLAGGSIHEVAQVVAAGGIVSNVDEAVIVKLARVLMLAPVMAGLGMLVAKHPALSAPAHRRRRPPIVPLFVVGFIVMMLVASTGLVPLAVLTGAKLAQTAFLACAMFALGLGVRLNRLIAVGPRPLVLGAASTLIVAAVALGGVLIVT